MPKTKTIAELRRELAAKEKMLVGLAKQRKVLAAQLSAIDRNISALEGTGAGAVAQPKKAKKAKRQGGRQRMTLPQAIAKVLAKSSAGMRAKDVASGVKKAGYKTKSKDFYNTVSATLGADKRFKRISRGVYKTA